MSKGGRRAHRRGARSGRASGSRNAGILIRAAILIPIAGLLILAVLLTAARSRVHQAPETNPARLLWLRLQASQDARDLPVLAQDAREILTRQPLSAQAAGLLAVVAARQGATAKADELMQASFDLNHRDLAVNGWLFDKAIQARRYPDAFTHADIMLRRTVEMDERLFPILMAAATDPAAIRPLAERMKAQTRWRTALIFALADDERTTQVVPALFTDIQGQGGRIQPAELSRLLVRLTEKGRFDQAYLNWLLFNPIEDLTKLRYVYDGDFEGWPEVVPFSWQYGGNADIDAMEDRPGTALRVSYDGVSATVLPRQLIMLTPGEYVLSMEYLNRSEEAGRRLVWTVACPSAPSTVATLEVPFSGGGWKRLETRFQTPADCPAQQLSLAPIRGDRRALVEVWFDKVLIEPAGGAM